MGCCAFPRWFICSSPPTGRVRDVDHLTADETYYLIISESLIDDGDVDVANNMQRRGWQAGWHESQTIGRPHGWFSVHNVGLSALVALPWGLGGTFGAWLAVFIWYEGRGSLSVARLSVEKLSR